MYLGLRSYVMLCRIWSTKDLGYPLDSRWYLTVDPVGRACLTDLDYSNSRYVTTPPLVIIMYTSCHHLQF